MCAHASYMHISSRFWTFLCCKRHWMRQKLTKSHHLWNQIRWNWLEAKPCERPEAPFLPIEPQLPSHWHLDKGYWTPGGYCGFKNWKSSSDYWCLRTCGAHTWPSLPLFWGLHVGSLPKLDWGLTLMSPKGKVSSWWSSQLTLLGLGSCEGLRPPLGKSRPEEAF